MRDFVVALGLAFALEGLLYAAFPDGMRNLLRQMLEWPARNIRYAGLIVAAVGIGVVWLGRG